MIMPRLAFEEPKGGPLAKAAQLRAAQDARRRTGSDGEPDQAEQPAGDAEEQLSELFFTEEEERQGRHRRRSDRDTVLVVLKAVTVAAGIALVGLVILLTTTGEDQPEARSPSVPDIPAGSESASGPTTTTSIDLGAVVAPPVHSQTTQMAPPPTTTTQPTVPTTTPGDGQGQFVRIGDPCDTPGAYAFTESYEPVVCGAGRHGNRLVWRRMFR